MHGELLHLDSGHITSAGGCVRRFDRENISADRTLSVDSLGLVRLDGTQVKKRPARGLDGVLPEGRIVGSPCATMERGDRPGPAGREWSTACSGPRSRKLPIQGPGPCR